MHVLMTKINKNTAEMIYTTIYNKNTNGKDDARSNNFSNNYTKISLFKRLKYRKNKVPQFSQIASATYFLNAFLT